MGSSEARYGLLVRLAWELWGVPANSLLVVTGGCEAVLWVLGPGGRREAVLAVPRGECWRLLWRGYELDAERLAEAARRIAAGVAA